MGRTFLSVPLPDPPLQALLSNRLCPPHPVSPGNNIRSSSCFSHLLLVKREARGDSVGDGPTRVEGRFTLSVRHAFCPWTRLRTSRPLGSDDAASLATRGASTVILCTNSSVMWCLPILLLDQDKFGFSSGCRICSRWVSVLRRGGQRFPRCHKTCAREWNTVSLFKGLSTPVLHVPWTCLHPPLDLSTSAIGSVREFCGRCFLPHVQSSNCFAKSIRFRAICGERRRVLLKTVRVKLREEGSCRLEEKRFCLWDWDVCVCVCVCVCACVRVRGCSL